MFVTHVIAAFAGLKTCNLHRPDVVPLGHSFSLMAWETVEAI